jgi:hypothetical protein
VRNSRCKLIEAAVDRSFVKKNSIKISLHRPLDYQRSSLRAK